MTYRDSCWIQDVERRVPVKDIQGNPSNHDTNGTEESVHISEVTGVKLHARTVLVERNDWCP